ncbi:MAG: arginase family protein [Deltaproteobacteria bacterium]|nr:arginase family protein [Deltaproteobacteria bacterium]
MKPLDELAALLRPAGGGLYLVSTGKAEQLELQKRLYGARDEARVQERFLRALERIPQARGVILGVPSDVGAGFMRGANLGPQAMRVGLLDAVPDFPKRAEDAGLVDIGDVFVVPQILHDEMLSASQIDASRRALYPNLAESDRATLPVSPLSICQRALELVFQLNKKVKPFILGGDHSVAWPTVAALATVHGQNFGIVQPDAHTDLLSERLGVKYCFGTWSYHANELLGRGGKLVQVGIRATRRDKAHWESLGLKQVWAREVRENPARALDEIIHHLRGLKLAGVYFSNDIDGTDAAWADATGTPEPDGLEPEFLVELIRRLGQEVGLVGGDLVELAPALGPKSDSRERTVGLAVRYVRETINAALGTAF